MGFEAYPFMSVAPNILSTEVFTAAVDALPLISMDLCVTDTAGRILLGLRVNAPAQGFWFTPGGRIRKGEGQAAAFARLMAGELGLHDIAFERAQLMGVWDHFYEDSAFSASVSTHYVNLPFWIRLTVSEVEQVRAEDQHSEWKWIMHGAKDIPVHPYAQNYVDWIGRKLSA